MVLRSWFPCTYNSTETNVNPWRPRPEIQPGLYNLHVRTEYNTMYKHSEAYDVG